MWFEVTDTRILADRFDVAPQRFRSGWVIEVRYHWATPLA